jgi:hypothetical protein
LLAQPRPPARGLGGPHVPAGRAGGFGVVEPPQGGECADRGDERAGIIPKGEAPCEGPDVEFCDTDKKAQTSSAIAIASGAVGAALIGAGVYFAFLSGDSSSEKGTTAKHVPPKPKTRFAPTFGTRGGGFALSGTF